MEEQGKGGENTNYTTFIQPSGRAGVISPPQLWLVKGSVIPIVPRAGADLGQNQFHSQTFMTTE